MKKFMQAHEGEPTPFQVLCLVALNVAIFLAAVILDVLEKSFY